MKYLLTILLIFILSGCGTYVAIEPYPVYVHRYHYTPPPRIYHNAPPLIIKQHRTIKH